MKRKCIGVLVTLIGLLGFAFLGVASASLVSVATKESMVAKQLTAMSVDILHAVHGGSEVPQSIDELVEMNICSKKDTIDAWGRVIELQRPSEDVIVLISRGDPAVSQKSPDISSTISCRIPVTGKTKKFLKP